MAVKTVRLVKLGAFEDVIFELSPGVNVLLGANSTGKTHALKWIYASLKPFSLKVEPGEDSFSLLRQKLTNVFVPAAHQLSRLIRQRSGASRGTVSIRGDAGGVGYGIDAKVGVSKLTRSWSGGGPVTFIPSRDPLALYEGFGAAYANREMSLDETYFDVCLSLGAYVLRGSAGDLAIDLSAEIEAILGGRVELDGGRFYVNFEPSRGPRLEAQLVSEGLRKLASIARLVRTGAIAPGGLLLWDEPEAGLNARLVRELALILGRLSRAGVQIVLATHDYLLARRISLLTEGNDAIPARFFLLSRENEGAPVTVTAADCYEDLPQTPIEEEYLRLQDDARAVFEAR